MTLTTTLQLHICLDTSPGTLTHPMSPREIAQHHQPKHETEQAHQIVLQPMTLTHGFDCRRACGTHIVGEQ
jgi:hypothetical protein